MKKQLLGVVRKYATLMGARDAKNVNIKMSKFKTHISDLVNARHPRYGREWPKFFFHFCYLIRVDNGKCSEMCVLNLIWIQNEKH
jgi:hypothetical protein